MNREPRRQRTYFILLLVTAFALLTIDYRSNGSSSPLHPLEKAIASVVGPGENAVSSLVKPLTDEVHIGKQPDKVAELQKQLDAALSLAETSQNDHRIVEQYYKLLGWPPYYVDRTLPARVVATGDTLSDDNSVTIDAGTRNGLHVNMTVVTGLGLIGNVVRVDATTATVQLLTDPSITVVVRNARTNTVGFVSGRPDGNLNLTQISQTTDIRVNDQIETLGSQNNEPYVADVPVGKVIAVENKAGAATHTAIVQPFASFDGLDEVGVIFPPTTPLPRGFLIAPITAAPTTSAAPTSSAVTTSPGGSAPPSGQVSGSPTTTPTSTRTSAPATTPTPTHTPSAGTTSHPVTTSPATSLKPTTPTTTVRPTHKATTKPPTAKSTSAKPPTTTTSPAHATTAAPPTTPTP